MKEVITVLGVTPDPSGGFKEWCINTAAVDPYRHGAVVNSEDGRCYWWNFEANTLEHTTVLTPGLGEAYTPTVVGPEGTAFALNNATLFALGDDNFFPSGFSVTKGTLVSGTTEDLYYVDGGKVIVRSPVMSSHHGYGVQVELTGSSFTDLSQGGTLAFHLTSSSSADRNHESVEFFNYSTNSFETVFGRSIGKGESSASFTISVDASRFIEPGTKSVRARISYLRSVPSGATSVWTVGINAASWEPNPPPG